MMLGEDKDRGRAEGRYDYDSSFWAHCTTLVIEPCSDQV